MCAYTEGFIRQQRLALAFAIYVLLEPENGALYVMNKEEQ